MAGFGEGVEHLPDGVVHVCGVGGVALERFVLGGILVERLARVELDEPIGYLDGDVDGGEGDVVEPRLFLAVDPTDDLSGDEVGGVAFFVEEFFVSVPGAAVRALLVAVVVLAASAG